MIVYEDGVKKHVKRLKVPTRMAATDVVPDKLYLAQLSFGSWTLVKVQCVKEPGWLRGRVNVRGFYTDGLGRYRAWATVAPVHGDRHVDMLVTRCRFEEPWLFVDDRQGTLMVAPDNYLQNHIDELIAAARRRQAEHDHYYMETLNAIRRLESLK